MKNPLALLGSDRHNATRNDANHHQECDCFEVALMCKVHPLRCDEVIQTVAPHYCATQEQRWKTSSFDYLEIARTSSGRASQLQNPLCEHFKEMLTKDEHLQLLPFAGNAVVASELSLSR